MQPRNTEQSQVGHQREIKFHEPGISINTRLVESKRSIFAKWTSDPDPLDGEMYTRLLFNLVVTDIFILPEILIVLVSTVMIIGIVEFVDNEFKALQYFAANF